ncbi:MAG TPA: ferritin-like domain-containing protein [Dehalococcoidales bacterium]|nr:ferritin-like domain-containing protein [Dehalococcoidales bacterium]
MITLTKKKLVSNQTILLELLNQTLELEYSLIIFYPRIANIIRDQETKKLALSLGTASVGHADTVAKAITKLGGNPHWSFASFPTGVNLRKIFQEQLEKEKLALRLHQQITGLVTDYTLRDNFARLAREEESHIRTVENILTRLD